MYYRAFQNLDIRNNSRAEEHGLDPEEESSSRTAQRTATCRQDVGGEHMASVDSYPPDVDPDKHTARVVRAIGELARCIRSQRASLPARLLIWRDDWLNLDCTTSPP